MIKSNFYCSGCENHENFKVALILTVMIFGVSLIIMNFFKITLHNLVCQDQLPKSGVGLGWVGLGYGCSVPNSTLLIFLKLKLKDALGFEMI